MKSILLPIVESDYLATDGRVIYLLKSLSKQFNVKLVTISKLVFDDVNAKLTGTSNITTKLIKMKTLPLTLEFRTNLVKAFVQYTDKLMVPGSDLKLWKVAAFDDFWGHIATTSPENKLEIDTDMVLVPLMSFDDTPAPEMDVFYTTVVFKAKEKGIKVVGYQLYPVFQSQRLMPRLMDGIVVKKTHEKDFHVGKGVDPDRIYLLGDARDSYAISPIDDAYMNLMYNDQIPAEREDLTVVVYNNILYRPQIADIIETIKEARLPVVLCMVKRDFLIKDIQEDEIIKEFYFEALTRTRAKCFIVDSKSSVPVTMIADVVVSPTYVVPIEFAARYGKKTFVYNPAYGPVSNVCGTAFPGDKETLCKGLKEAYREKSDALTMSDIANRVLGRRS